MPFEYQAVPVQDNQTNNSSLLGSSPSKANPKAPGGDRNASNIQAKGNLGKSIAKKQRDSELAGIPVATPNSYKDPAVNPKAFRRVQAKA